MSTPIGKDPIITKGTPLVYLSDSDEYYVGTAVGFVLEGGGALIIDAGLDGLQEWNAKANEHLYTVRTRYDELVAERDEWKKRALKAEAMSNYEDVARWFESGYATGELGNHILATRIREKFGA